MLPPFFPHLHLHFCTYLHEERQRLAIKQRIPPRKTKKKKRRKVRKIRGWKLENRRNRVTISYFSTASGRRNDLDARWTFLIVLKNELRPKRSMCTASLSPSTRDTAITSRPRLILFDQRINELNVIYHASLCFVSSFVPLPCSSRSITRKYLGKWKKDTTKTRRYREKSPDFFSPCVATISTKLEENERDRFTAGKSINLFIRSFVRFLQRWIKHRKLCCMGSTV